MRSNSLRFLLIVSLLLNITVLATAAYQYYGQSSTKGSLSGMDMKNGKHLFEKLSLSPAQSKLFHAKAMSFHGELDRIRQDIAVTRKELVDRMRADNTDKKAISAAIAAISGKQEEMQEMVTLHMLEVKALLDKKQQKKFFDVIESAMAEDNSLACAPVEHQ